MKITIGLTRTDRAANYVPAMDGYRPGAAQDIVVLDIPAELEQPVGGWQAVEVGEAYFTATNAPEEVVLRDLLATTILRELKAREYGIGHRLTMDVGDTIQVDGGPLVSCESFGWKEVAA